MGELVSKLGERVLPKLISILQRGLREGETSHRQGVCLGLAELMSAAGRDTVDMFLADLIATTRTGLCDANTGVRVAAARAFATLQHLIGVRAITDIVPSLLQLLRSKECDQVLQGQSGLREVMGQRPQAVVPYLLPKLCASPVTLSHARAIAAVAEVAGAALHTHLDEVLPALLKDTFVEAELVPGGKEADTELRDALVHAAKSVALSVEEDGLHYLSAEISLAMANKAVPHVRAAAAVLVANICKESTRDLAPYHHSFMQILISMFHAPQHAVLRAGSAALDALIKSLSKERYPLHVSWLRQQVQNTPRASHIVHLCIRTRCA